MMYLYNNSLYPFSSSLATKLLSLVITRGIMKMKIYDTILAGRFIDRPNRFVAHVEINGNVETCHMPNPGRMRELLFPGVTMYVTPNTNPKSKTAYRVIGVAKGKDIFYLDTSRCNDVAAYMVEHHMIPGWEKYVLLRREVTMGDSRFDLLLGDPETGEVFPVEVKSCSLAGQVGAMFPDAPTTRGEKHIEHLVHIGKEGGHGGLLILVHYGHAQWFLPDFHTDPAFANIFYQGASFLDWKAAVLSWTPAFEMPEHTRLIPTSMRALKYEMGDRGNYLLILSLADDMDMEIVKGHRTHFSPGYYVYVGTAEENLVKQMNYHRHLRKHKKGWIDEFREKCDFVGIIPIRSGTHLEKDLTMAMRSIADWTVDDVLETDHAISRIELFGFHKNPMHLHSFTSVEETFQIDRFNMYFEK